MNDRASPLSVPPHRFAQQMQYLADTGIPVIALSDLVRRLKMGETCGGSVVLTFDDGYQDNYTAALPVLQRHSFPATLFMITDMIGARQNGHTYLTAAQLQEMAGSGVFDIGTHTKSHPRLSCLDADEARTEVEDSKAVLEDLLGKAVRFLAYPWGAYNGETQTILQGCGLEAAVAVDEGTVSSQSRLYTLPRNSIQCSTSFSQFRGSISTAIDSYTRVRDLVLGK